ncbi:MAG: lysylphosphatidylglycerol synthase transmembrane domain-containing protein [Myxococcales bacterium]
MRRLDGKFFVRLFLSLAVSAIFAAFSLRHTDLSDVAAAIAAAKPGPIFGYLGILLVVHVVKTVRWGVLLKPLGEISFRRLNSASAVGFMLMVLLPLRLGELARPLLVARPQAGEGHPLPRAATLATCLVERSVDILAVGVLGIISLQYLAPSGEAAELVRHGATLVTAGFAALCVGLVVAFFMREQTVALLRRVLRPISPNLAERVALLTDRFIGGMHLGSAASVLWFLALTAGYWSLHVWGFWLVATAFALPITPLMACTVLTCQVVGIMIPAGPGQVGTSQFFTQLGLSIFVPASLTVAEVAARAAGYANTIWLLQFGQQVVTGIVFLALGQVSLRGIFDRWEGDPLAAEKAVGE